MTTSPDFIEMAGQTVPGKHILNRAKSTSRRAHWWVRCSNCAHQQIERGCNLRKAQKRAEYRIVCKKCGA